ncbi:MAG: chorismate mutase [Actinomycetota bacterium]
MRVRAIRGATQLSVDDSSEMADAVTELLTDLFAKNGIHKGDLISIFFTSTPDLTCDFPAAAARTLDLGDIPLMCAREIDVVGSLPRVVRIMIHAYSERSHEEIKHLYKRGAEVLRRDIAQ